MPARVDRRKATLVPIQRAKHRGGRRIAVLCERGIIAEPGVADSDRLGACAGWSRRYTEGAKPGAQVPFRGRAEFLQATNALRGEVSGDGA